MVNATDNTDPGRQIRDNYVPLEKRDSENTSWKPFAWSIAKSLLVTKLSFWAGYFTGKHMAPHKIKIGGVLIDSGTGAAIGGIIGGAYETYDHWHKAKGQQVGVKQLSTDLNTALDPEHFRKETETEQKIIDGLMKLQDMPHASAEIARRESRMGRTGPE